MTAAICLVPLLPILFSLIMIVRYENVVFHGWVAEAAHIKLQIGLGYPGNSNRWDLREI